MKKLLGILILFSFIFALPTAIQMDFLVSGVMFAGKPLAQGKVYSYVNDGGTTYKAVYASSRVATNNILANPMTLDDSGVPTSIPYGYGVYRMVIKDKTGVTRYTLQNISYGVVNSQTGVVDVKAQYGVNDAAIASAIADAGSANVVFLFTPGEYTIGNNQTFPLNITLQFQKGAYFTVAAGITATISGNIEADNVSIFRGLGYVSYSTVNNVLTYDYWRGVSNSITAYTTFNTQYENSNFLNMNDGQVNNTLNVRNLIVSTDSYFNRYEFARLPIFGTGTTSFVCTTNSTLDGINEYQDFTIPTGSTLVVKSVATGGLGFLILKVRGTMFISGNISGAGSGGAGGALGVVGSNGLQFGGTGGSGGGNGGTAGGSGGAVINQFGTYAGGVGDTNAGKTGITSSPYMSYIDPLYVFGYGAGGGGGLVNVGNIGGNGGGGFVVIAKNLVISGNPTITCAGANGVTGGGASTTAGGSGGGGVVGMFYKSLTGSMPMLNVSGGIAADGFANDGGTGGNGCTVNMRLY